MSELPGTSTEPRAARPEGDPAGRLAGALHVLALFNLAVAQPLFDLSSRQAAFLVAHRLQPFDLLAVALALSWLAPLILIAAVRLLGLASKAAGRVLHLFLVFGLLALLGLLLAKRTGDLPAAAVIAAAVAAAALGLAAYVRAAPLRAFLSVLALGAVVVPLVFLLSPAVRSLLFPPRVAVPGKSDPRSTPVVMVVFDALPLSSLMDADGGIAGGRFPAFAELARRSHWFRNATTVSDQTQYALPPIVTGKYPVKGKLLVHADYPDSLFTLLGGHYEIRAVEQISQLCPPALCRGQSGGLAFGERMSLLASDLRIVYLHLVLPPRFAGRLPDVGSNWSRFGARQAPGRATETSYVKADFERFLSSIEERPLSALYFVHVLLPHVPWIYSPSGREYGRPHEPDEPEGVETWAWGDDEWLVLQGLQRHLLQLGYADRLLGEALERLRRLGLFDPALVVVTADHGASFRPGDSRRFISPTNFHEILPVPLFLKLPNQQRGVVHDENVETIDVLPTMAGVLGLRPKGKLDGRDALDAAFEPRPRKVFLDVDRARALPLGATIDEKLASARSIAERLGGDWESLYRLGPHGGLVGRRLEELRIRPPDASGFEVELEQAWLFDDLDLRDRYLPTRVLGTLRAPDGARGPFHLAVAVNGEIRAATRTPRSASSALGFSAMVPEHGFRNGANDVRVFVIEEDGGEPAALLATAAASAVTYALDAARGTIASSAGESFRIEPEAVRGAAWVGGVGLEGWAADLGNQVPADRIVVFAHGEGVSSAGLHFVSPQLAERFDNERLGSCGFRAIVSAAVVEDPQRAALRVFALAGSAASEIPLVENPARLAGGAQEDL